MITAVYFEDDDGGKVVVAAFMVKYDAKVFIEGQKFFRKLELKDLTLDASEGWQLIINETNKAKGNNT